MERLEQKSVTLTNWFGAQVIIVRNAGCRYFVGTLQTPKDCLLLGKYCHLVGCDKNVLSLEKSMPRVVEVQEKKSN